MTFTTALTLSGPLRHPRQLLADQEYGGHSSIHDDATAEKLGLRAMNGSSAAQSQRITKTW